jgi:hypothetical protein
VRFGVEGVARVDGLGLNVWDFGFRVYMHYIRWKYLEFRDQD